MKKMIATITFIFLLAGYSLLAKSAVQDVDAPVNKYDFSALSDGIKLTNELKFGFQPSEQQWQILFEHQAYELIFSISDLGQEKL
ncbi:hypothetical protein CJF42_15895 [Pseudoalteromonas sp. NBT06-2]|uniref:hypothetical protein n=1 Tax=Pseudoalteromonas sp. NBT06-2 TaxID=2025950 RepID=UPI000BA7E1B1|nr:hypothetical protein [Pseudoalteromonas sp. NBT06-2]PAJ73398.1 hypothetical protein CJF42_15895 [Pseudoalteromonas sp. NBT06-2]